jgi:hypothetical protein
MKANVWLAAVNLAALEEAHRFSGLHQCHKHAEKDKKIQLQLVQNDNTPSLQGVVLQYMS